MFLGEYVLVILVSLSSVNAFSIAIRTPSVLAKGGGRGGGGGHSSSGGSGGGSHGSIGASTGRGLSGDTGHPAVSFSANGVNGRSANYFSYGGGKPFTLPSSSAFAGRSIGGGTRDQVVGTPRYASGYPYSVSRSEFDTTRRGVYGQPFPFGFYPIYWGYHGYGGEYAGGEGRNIHYNSSILAERPGGNLSYVHLVPKNGSTHFSTSRNDSYWMIGDYESVNTMLSLLVDSTSKTYGCDAQNSTILPFITVSADGGPLQYNVSVSQNGTSATNNTNSTLGSAPPFRFENVIQWYRASSFALAYQGYNNTYAFLPLNETTPPSDWASSTPLPDTLTQSAFLRCVNTTISAALPILDGDHQDKLSTGAIVGAVLGSVFGAALIGVAAFFLWKRHAKAKKSKQAYKVVSAGHERKPSEGPVVHESDRTMVDDDMLPAYSGKPLVQDAKDKK